MSASLYACAMGVVAEWQDIDPSRATELRLTHAELTAALDDLMAQYLREQERAT